MTNSSNSFQGIMSETVAMKKSEEYEKWKIRRNRTTYTTYFIIFLAGLEINAITIAMLYYLEEAFNITSDQIRLYYSVAEMFNSLGQLSSGLLIGRYIDKTRNLRLPCLLILWATIVGNLLYSLPFNISFILIGRFLCGFNEALQVALCGKKFSYVFFKQSGRIVFAKCRLC